MLERWENHAAPSATTAVPPSRKLRRLKAMAFTPLGFEKWGPRNAAFGGMQ
jgi:hypothetical protein